MAIEMDAIPAQEPSYRLEMLDGEALLFDPANRHLVHCNETAVLVWSLCDGQRSVQEIVTLLSEAYPEAGAAVSQDTMAVLAQFLDAHAIRIG